MTPSVPSLALHELKKRVIGLVRGQPWAGRGVGFGHCDTAGLAVVVNVAPGQRETARAWLARSLDADAMARVCLRERGTAVAQANPVRKGKVTLDEARAAAADPSTPPERLDELLLAKDEGVRVAALGNGNLSQAALARWSRHDGLSETEARALLSNPQWSFVLLEQPQLLEGIVSSIVRPALQKFLRRSYYRLRFEGGLLNEEERAISRALWKILKGGQRWWDDKPAIEDDIFKYTAAMSNAKDKLEAWMDGLIIDAIYIYPDSDPGLYQAYIDWAASAFKTLRKLQRIHDDDHPVLSYLANKGLGRG